MARLRALLRTPRDGRRATRCAPRYDDGRLVVDLVRREVTLDGEPVALTRKEYAVLALLLRHAGRVVSQQQLLREVWGATHVQDTHYLRIVIGRLRQKLGDDPAAPRWLKTEPGVGYRFLGAADDYDLRRRLHGSAADSCAAAAVWSAPRQQGLQVGDAFLFGEERHHVRHGQLVLFAQGEELGAGLARSFGAAAAFLLSLAWLGRRARGGGWRVWPVPGVGRPVRPVQPGTGENRNCSMTWNSQMRQGTWRIFACGARRG